MLLHHGHAFDVVEEAREVAQLIAALGQPPRVQGRPIFRAAWMRAKTSPSSRPLRPTPACCPNCSSCTAMTFSGVFPEVELGADGRFGYQKLPLYWS